ncbi:hypothetical protein [Streptomyces sp. PR69]|uniref:hypothetical protein n=1 Tax=Streptomyces sp. PR69 TaxID=2984950 RepID=UPI0022654BFC|nr:hypothetical protein [Streptomyces sp. PR69]
MADDGGMSADERMLRMVNPALASMLYDPESMTSFKKRVDKLLVDLMGSPAAPDQVGASPVGRSQFGGGGGAWAEASGIFNAYENVITQLKELSQLLADCIEGMGIAVVSAKDGYQGMDDDVRRRMLAIRQRTEDRYDPERDPVAQELARERAQAAGGADTAPGTGNGDSAGAGGYQ